jgi:RNA polymerase sigma factor (TIGR02999 family)
MVTESEEPENAEDLQEGAGWAEGLTFDQAYLSILSELKILARQVRHKDPSATISTSSLVSEAWIKLHKSPHLKDLPEGHFKAIAARAMRQVLVEAARKKAAGIRDGGERVDITLSGIAAKTMNTGSDVLALNDALNQLKKLNSRQATIVELRYFLGLTVAETAEVIEVAEATVNREWRAAKAWLKVTIKTAIDHPGMQKSNHHEPVDEN